eukprot:gene5933-7387_t
MEQQQQQQQQYHIEIAKQIERNCDELQSGDYQIRTNAEQFLLKFTKMPNPYSLCFGILPHSRSTWAHFYALTAIRDGAIREWSALEGGVKLQIVQELFKYISGLPTSQFINSATKNQSYNTLAVICKRSWLDTDKYHNNVEMNQLIMETVYSHLDSPRLEQIEIAIGICHNLVQEFSSSTKAAQIQLTWDFHQTCQSSFQALHLQPIFRKTMQLLNQLKGMLQQHQQGQQLDPKMKAVLYTTLVIFTEILDWKFVDPNSPKLSYLSYGNGANYMLKPGGEWESLFRHSSSPPVLELIFSLYPLVSKLDQIPNLVRCSMTQVAGLTGPVLREAHHKNQYVLNLLKYLSPLIEQSIVTRNWSEMEDISNVVYRLCHNFKFSSLILISNEVAIPFIQNIGRFIFSSLELMKITVDHGEEDLEDEIENDCFDILLKAWVSLIADAEFIVNKKKTELLENFNEQYSVLKSCSEQIYCQYIKTRLELSKIELNKYEHVETNADDDNEIDEDKKKYEEQLKSIAYIGRLNPGASSDLLKSEINRYINYLKEVTSDPVAFESLHWLFIFSGHLLFDSENTTPSAIPNGIENFTYEQAKQGSPTDAVVELSNAVFRFSIEYENVLLMAGKADCISPLVAQTSLWFLSGWSLVYLIPSQSMNIHLSPKIIENYSNQNNVANLVDYLVKKILVNLVYWKSEVQVLQETTKLFSNLCLNTETCKYLIGSSSWANLFYLQDPGLQSLPPIIYGRLFQGFTKVIYSLGSGGANNPSLDQPTLFSHLTKSITEQMDSVLSRPDFQSISQEAYVKENIFLLLEKFKGILSVNPELSDSDDINLGFNFFIKYAKPLIAMIPLYEHCHDIILLILNLFSCLSENQLEYLDLPRANIIFPIIIEMFQIVSKVTTVKTIESKEYYSRIKMLIKILYNIILFNDQQNNFPALIQQTVFHGVCVIVPCITNNGLLQYPKLARKFFGIATFLFGSTDIDIQQLPANVKNTLYSLVEFGISYHDPEIAKGSLECIQSLSKTVLELNRKQIHFDQNIIVQYIGSVINFLLLQDFNADELLLSASDTLFSLISINPEGYKSKLTELIARQDHSIQHKILQQFQHLPITPELSSNRKIKDEAIKQLQSILLTVKPLLNRK